MLIANSTAWINLKNLTQNNYSLSDLFVNDLQRQEKMSLQVEDLFVDYSKNLVNSETMTALFDLAREAKLETAIQAMFKGEVVNQSEQRPALHTALRNPDSRPEVRQVLEKMAVFTKKIHDHTWLGFTGKPIQNIINIGIGGSNLGPKMAYQALLYYKNPEISAQFVSNIDPTDLTQALEKSNPETTLFIISSKTFTTDETMTNAQAAKNWLTQKLGPGATAKHFVAVSTNAKEVKEFGIDQENMFIFWDWVGGRYSLSSAIGLAVMLAVGENNFREMLAGFYEIDKHYQSTPLEKNLPIIMALLNIWYTDFLNCQTHAIIPYDQYLKYFPDHLQQLIMESLGKNSATPTGPVIWGGIGSDVQHSFFQLLHQGTLVAPVDFIGFRNSLNPLGDQQKKLLANLLAQAQALAFGSQSPDPYLSIPGNKPSNIILADRLTPKVLGELVALYEHITHAWGTILGINCFDQPGVQYGKVAAQKIYMQLNPNDAFFHICQLR